MTSSVLIAHSPEDSELAEQIAAALQTLCSETTASCSSLRGAATADVDARAAQIAASQTVLALLTPRGADSQDVLLQLGAGWALGKQLVMLIAPGYAASQVALPPLPAQRVALDAESVIGLAESLASANGGRTELGPAARLVLSELFPGWSPVRESSEQPIARASVHSEPRAEAREEARVEAPAEVRAEAPVEARPEPRSDQTQDLLPVQSPPPEPETTDSASRLPADMLPRATTSLDAGRTLADAVFESEEQPADADGLDVPFGAFLASLGGNWSSLREIPDVEVWREATENLLESLPPAAQPTRGWYEVGFHAALLLQLARRQLELEGSDESLERKWQQAWSALREGAWRAGLAQTAVDELHAMLDNLRGPLRDFTNLGRAQARVQELAVQADQVA
jgi:hypothetical protein